MKDSLRCGNQSCSADYIANLESIIAAQDAKAETDRERRLVSLSREYPGQV